ncbi:hypothetical protein [uncultured Jatrophihabitans sp.]|uniref:hypothetical protein n=1 Tax=uncultured Jatrophihabitans sp. TaxID=1610747 RepID=UPI0035CB510A
MLRFDGSIAGIGTSSGVRLVVGMWTESPFGPIADVMIERPNGGRTLLAPHPDVGAFIAGTYRFDDVRSENVRLDLDGDTRTVVADSLVLRFVVGRRTPAGRLLALVPRRLARARWWVRAIDPVARLVRRGVRTAGTAGGGRREWYCALDEHRVVQVQATLDGVDLGGLRRVTPPVRFGFASTPPSPSLVRVTTWIDADPPLPPSDDDGATNPPR